MRPKDRTLSSATTPSQSELRSDGNEGVMSYPGYSLGVGSLSVEMQSIYLTALANCAIKIFV